MSLGSWLLLGLASAIAVYAVFVVALLVLGRRKDARALAGFVPDCLVLFGGLLRDPAIPSRHKVPLALLAAYLALPFDLVPDFLPVVGQLDDVILAGWVLRRLVRAAGPEAVVSHWPGPDRSLVLLLRVAGSGSGPVSSGRGRPS